MEQVIENLNEFFSGVADEVFRELQKDSEYQLLMAEENRLLKEFPIIEELNEGINTGVSYELDKTEREAFETYWNIRMDMQLKRDMEYYFRGHRDCMLYLIQSGIIGKRR